MLERGSQSHLVKETETYVGDVFKSHDARRSVTITSGEAGAAIYVDGTLVKSFPNFAFSREDLTGSAHNRQRSIDDLHLVRTVQRTCRLRSGIDGRRGLAALCSLDGEQAGGSC